MKKSLIISIVGIIALSSLFFIGNYAVAKNKLSAVENKLSLVKSETVENYNYYVYDAAKDGYKSIRSDVLTPKYYIFAGNKTEDDS